MKKKNRIFLTALLFVPLIFFGCARTHSTSLPPSSELGKPTISELKPKVDELLASGDAVMIRRGIDDVFALIDLLLAAGEEGKALSYMSDALKHNSWALDYQMRYAEIISRRAGETELAQQKAKLVLEHAEQDDLFDRANRMLGNGLLPPIPPFEPGQDYGTTLVLVPVGRVDRCVMHDLQREIGSALSIPVILRDAHVEVPAFKRDPVKRYLAEVRSNLFAAMKQDVNLVSFLQERGLMESQKIPHLHMLSEAIYATNHARW